MLVELGNKNPTKVTEERSDPTVTYVSVPDGYTYAVAQPGARMTVGEGNEIEVTSAAELAAHAADHVSKALLFRDGITHLPDQEALLAVFGAWQSEGTGTPDWVWSDNEDFAVLLGAFFGCAVGRPADVEATHHTDAGPPGVGVDREALSEAAAAIAVANEPNLEGTEDATP